MKRFVSNLIAFSAIILFSISFLGIPPKHSPNKSDYMGAIIEKHQRLSSLKGRRILLVGGSNLAFGVDSKKIQQRFIFLVVNLALHAGLGLNFILSEAAHVSRNGDVIIFSPEYYLGNVDPALRARVAEVLPEAASYYSASPLLPLKLYYSDRIANMRARAIHTRGLSNFFNIEDIEASAEYSKETSIYARNSFNEYGDAIGHLNRRTPKRKNFDLKLGAYHYYDGIDKINDFYLICQNKKVRVFFLYPPLAQSAYLENKKLLNTYQVDLSNNMKIPILNTPTSNVFADSLFYDTHYHLTKHGREIRTDNMITVLSKQNIK